MRINKKQLIYVVDDDKPFNTMICKFLQKEGFKNVVGFYSGEELFQNIKKDSSPLIIQDFDLPGMNGLEILKKAKQEFPKTEFIFLSGQSSIGVAVDTIKNGAFDYVIKDSFARENIYNKIRNIMKIKTLVLDRKVFMFCMGLFVVLLVASWIYLTLNFLGK